MERLEVLADDIRKSQADAIVCIANTVLPGGENLSEKILQNAMIDLMSIQLEPGKAVLLSGKCVGLRHIIWSNGPEWQGGNRSEPAKLAECYASCLELAEMNHFETLDILAVPTDLYNSQLFQVATTTLQTVRDFLLKKEFPKRVRIVCQNTKMVEVYKQAYNFWFADVKATRMEHEGWD